MLHTLLFCNGCSPLLRQGLLLFFWKCLTLEIQDICLEMSCSQTWSLCRIGCKNLTAISDTRNLLGFLWYWVVALPCGVHMWSTYEAWTRCFKEIQSGRLRRHWMESCRACSMKEKNVFGKICTSVNLRLCVMLIANNCLGLKLFCNSLFHAVFSTLL